MSKIIVNSDGSVSVPLAFPVTDTQGATVTEVRVRRAKGKDLRALTGQDMGQLWIISQLSGLPAPVIDAMDATDVATLAQVSQRFLQPSLEIGDLSLPSAPTSSDGPSAS